MFEQAINSFEFSQRFTTMMVQDVEDDRLAEQPRPKMNHAAWLLGHLALTADFVGRFIGAEPTAPEGWMELCGPGSMPVSDRSKYPTKQELLDGLERSRLAVPEVLAQASPQWLEQPAEGEMFQKMGLATNHDVITGVLTAHHGFHTGQLSAWRRAMGYPPMFQQ